MYSVVGNTTSLVLGFPIRTSSDQRSVDNSPRHNAASHVLHRPLMPRHPPCALKHLQTHKNQEKLHKNRHATTKNAATHPFSDARNHYPILKHHTPPPKPWGNNTQRCCLRTQQCAGSFIFPAKKQMHPAPTHYKRELLTATPHQLECLTWCSLERR